MKFIEKTDDLIKIQTKLSFYGVKYFTVLYIRMLLPFMFIFPFASVLSGELLYFSLVLFIIALFLLFVYRFNNFAHITLNKKNDAFLIEKFGILGKKSILFNLSEVKFFKIQRHYFQIGLFKDSHCYIVAVTNDKEFTISGPSDFGDYNQIEFCFELNNFAQKELDVNY